MPKDEKRNSPALDTSGGLAGRFQAGSLDHALLVVINGPPRTGKDHAARAIAASSAYLGRPTVIRRISDELKLYTHRKYGVGELPADHFEAVKDVPCAGFGGRTPRQAYIETSEKVIKPEFGEGALGDLLSERMLAENDTGEVAPESVYLLPGAGCWPEVEPIAALFSPSRIFLLRVSAAPVAGNEAGKARLTDYRGDLAELERAGVQTGQLVNDFTESFTALARERVADFLSMHEIGRIAGRETGKERSDEAFSPA